MAQVNTLKLKASTLLEVIVAMVIILIVFVLATGIFSNVIRSSPSLKAQKINAVISGVLEKSMQNGDWQDEVIQVDSMQFQKTVTSYQGRHDLLLISLSVIEDGKEIQKREMVIKGTLDEVR